MAHARGDLRPRRIRGALSRRQCPWGFLPRLPSLTALLPAALALLVLRAAALREVLDSLLHGGLELREQGDHPATGAGGEAERGVTDDPRHGDDGALRVAALRAASRGELYRPGHRVDTVSGHLPGEEADDRPLGLRRRRLAAVVADRRDRGRQGVEALRLGADHGPLQPPGAALVERPVAVDERVVADVVPAVAVDVEATDAEHDRGRLLGRVVIGVHRVV